MARSAVPTPMRLLGPRAHPLYAAVLPIPIICFVGVLITDLAYIASADMMWLDFSSWLLLAGLIGGGVAGALLIVELIRAHDRRRLLPHFLLLLAAWVVEVFNSFIHARDGWTAVVPTGLTLSIVAALLGLLAGWFWQSAYHRTAEFVR
ncbi:DUF2231 domain-containing protein [uncultured Sphingomonas sp.]|uniref:DUF2231 domain-containing protein n=1 Tax=uncultured Sphingomonas sp. TaxID=158754 RepID=UPI0035CB4886